MASESPDFSPGGWDALAEPLIAPSGFREYDARWRYPEEINLPGMAKFGAALGTQMREAGVGPEIVVGCDFREYSPAVKGALIVGLVGAGAKVKDIGVAVSPMAYFARLRLGIDAVAMVTASHNPNGWTGVKTGFRHPHTHGPREVVRLREIVERGQFHRADMGGYERVVGLEEDYIASAAGGYRMKRRLRAVCATGNGTASMFAPRALDAIGVEVVPLHNEPDSRFPNYNPNPEAVEMLEDMGTAVRSSGADLALGFDGDGDRLGVVDDEGEEIYSDKVGVLLAREFARGRKGARFVVDIKSTGLYRSDPVLRELGASTEYWKTGHSHMKLRTEETGALAGIEKSGHFFFSGDIGDGYDCALRAAVEVCKMLDRHPDQSLSDLKRSLPRTWLSPTMSPYCPDGAKYAAADRISERLEELMKPGSTLGGLQVVEINRVNGARVELENGSWALVRASSNTPNLVVVCESTSSRRELVSIFLDLDRIVRTEECVGPYDQSL